MTFDYQCFQAPENTDPNHLFSIIIPSWNNLPYLQMCIASIERNATFKHQIIVLANEGKDGTVQWLKARGDLDFMHATENLGICFGVNLCRSLVKTQYVLYINDDMYVCPDWDLHLKNAIDAIGHQRFFLSATMIEHTNTNNPCVILADFGDSLQTFREQALLQTVAQLPKRDWNGATWPPSVCHVDLWDTVGGLSCEYHPGMYSDPDFSMKLWKLGIRHFQGVGKSRVYHFGSKSTKRKRMNLGRDTFFRKWQLSANDFGRYMLKCGSDFEGPLPDVELGATVKLKNYIKRFTT